MQIDPPIPINRIKQEKLDLIERADTSNDDNVNHLGLYPDVLIIKPDSEIVEVSGHS